MNRRQAEILGTFLVTSALCGCSGGDGTPAETPGTPATAEPAATTAASAEPGAAEPAADGTGEPGSEDSGTANPGKQPRFFITADDTTFSFDFDASDIGKKAIEQCEKQAGDNPEVRIKCIRKARNRIPLEVLHFFKDDEGFMWVTYRRTGNKLNTVRGIPFEFGEETANTIELKSTGKPLGIGPSGVPRRKVVITIRDEFSIQIPDPQRGNLVYNAKLGLIPK